MLPAAALTAFIISHHTFISSKNKIRHHPSSDVIIRYPRLFSQSNDDDEANENNKNDDNENEQLLNELRNKKQHLFGTDIPQSDEFQKAAQNAENEFLSAMLQQRHEFQSIKKKEGSDKACEEFMKRIQISDEEASQNQSDMKESEEEDDRGDVLDKMWFVEDEQQQIEMEANVGDDIDVIREVADDDNDADNAWQ